MTNHNENTTRTTARLTAEILTAATTAMTKAWDELAATSYEEAEALTASLTDLTEGDRGADTTADLNQPDVAEALGGEGAWADWEDEDWLAWDAAVTATAKVWLADHQPTDPIPAEGEGATATLTLTGEEVQALEEVCDYEADTLSDSDGWESEEEAEAAEATADLLSAICQRLNTAEGMMTVGGTLTVTLAEAVAIAEAVGDAGWVMGEVKADDAGSDEEAERSHATANTAFSVRNNQLAEAIAQLVALSIRVPGYEFEGEEPPEWVWDTVFSFACEMCGISTESDECWLWDTLSDAVTRLVSGEEG